MTPIRMVALAGAVVVMLASSQSPARAQETGAGKSSQLTDAQIAAIVLGANAIDVEYGRLVGSRSRNADVRRFAELMVSSHTAVNEQVSALLSRLRLIPVESETSRGLAASAKAKRSDLSVLSGEAFDRAYIANEVAFHEAVLEAIDTALLPNAQHPELRALIEAVRPAIVGHLEHAKQVRARLGG